MADLYKMTANAGFTNPRIKGPRDNGAVLPGEEFETDFLHARELKASGIAEPGKGVDLDKEPTDEVEPHHSLSVSDHKAINERRAKATEGKASAGEGNGGKK